MEQSVKRKLKRGHIRMIWNNTFKRMDFFRRTSNGRFVLCNPLGRDVWRSYENRHGHHVKTLDGWQNDAA